MADDDLGARLARFVGERLGAPVRVTHLERSTEGFSQETFVFDVEAGRERRGYVAKREPVAGLLEPYDLEPEFRVLHALSDDPLPSPPTPWFTRDPAVLERPFYVMERLPGEVPIPAVRADGSGPFDDAERAALGPQVARALARLHAIDWRARGFQFLGAPRPGREAAPERLRFYEVLAFVKMIAIMLSGLDAFRSGRTTDLRMAIFDHQLPFLHLLLGMTRGWLAGAPA